MWATGRNEAVVSRQRSQVGAKSGAKLGRRHLVRRASVVKNLKRIEKAWFPVS